MSTSRTNQSRLLDNLRVELDQLKSRVQALEAGALLVPITTLDPEPFKLLKEIKVIVRAVDGEFVASFVEANVNAQGATEAEAVHHLKDVMLALFEHLASQPATKLGPGPARQLAILKAFIRKRA